VRRRSFGRQQQHHVDVGVREQLAAAVAANRDQRNASRHRGLGPQAAQDLIDQSCMLAQQA
jgi:hypothetical protein